MKAFFRVVAASCIFVRRTPGTSASIDIDNTPRNHDPAVGVTESDSTSSRTSSSNGIDNNDGNRDEQTNANNSNRQRRNTPRQSTNYYDSNQNNHRQKNQPKYDDEQTYLDIFGERAKELLTLHVGT